MVIIDKLLPFVASNLYINSIKDLKINSIKHLTILLEYMQNTIKPKYEKILREKTGYSQFCCDCQVSNNVFNPLQYYLVLYHMNDLQV